MPLCQSCRQFFPPPHVVVKETPGGEIYKCIFCETNNNKITFTENNIVTTLTKEQAIRDYKEFIGKIKQSPKISDKLIKKGVKDLKGLI